MKTTKIDKMEFVLNNKEIINKLFKSYFKFKIQNNIPKEISIPDNELLEIIKIIYFSMYNEYKVNPNLRTLGLQLFYILIELNLINKTKISNLKLWLGDLPWIKDNTEDGDFENDEKLMLEGYKLKLIKNNLYLYKNQDIFFDNLNEDKNIFINAPTSFGKTKMILEQFRPNWCIIVPTIALLNELSNELRGKFKNNKIITKSNFKYDKNCFYIFTQEKLINFLKINKNVEFSKLIVDECHHLLLNDTRSFVLRKAIDLVYKLNNKTSFIFLAPNAKLDFFKDWLDDKLFNSIKELNLSKTYITERIFFIFKENNDKNDYEVSYFNTALEEEITLIKNYTPEFNELFVDIASKLKNKPIIYTSKSKMNEHANILLNNIKIKTDNNDLRILINYLEKFIGEEYNVLKFIKKGILIHNGDIDKTTKLLIENIFKNNNDIYLFANETLISGVNLNCSNLLLLNNRTNGGQIKIGHFKNLIGRVGRYNPKDNDSYLGTVFFFNEPKKVSFNKIKENILKDPEKEDFETKKNNELEKEISQNDDYETAQLKQMYKEWKNNKNNLKDFVYIREDKKEKVKNEIINNANFFINFFKDKNKKTDTVELFIDKISKIFEWKDINPFVKKINNNELSFLTPLKIYYFNYLRGLTIKEIFNQFIKWIKKNNKKYYLIEQHGKKWITQEKTKKEATNSDIIDITIQTINNWIEVYLNSYIYYILFTIYENVEDENVDFSESLIFNVNNEIEMQLLEVGIERHLIRDFVKIKNDAKDINEIIDEIKNNQNKYEILYKIIESMNL